MNRILQAFSRHQDSGGAEEYMSEDDYNGQQQDNREILKDHSRCHHHTYRDEEDGAEQVFDRSD